MEYRELIGLRRSVRAMEAGRQIGKETLEEILRQAQMAPSWKNSQTARSYVVCSPEAVQELREKCLPAFNQKSSANACAYIVTTFVKNVAGFSAGQPDNELGNEWGAYDLGLRDAYLVLSAADHGIDTLIMGIRDEKALREMLNIPDSEEVAAVLSLGYREGEPALRPRKEPGEVAVFI